MKLIFRSIILVAVAGALPPMGASAQDCATAVQDALAKGSLNVASVAPEGVQIVLQGELAGETDPDKLKALLNNIECALAGPGGRLKRLELISPTQEVLARKSGGQIEILAKRPS